MAENTTPTPQVVGIINFHGLTLWVVDHEGTEYIPARALVNLAGTDWKTARNGLFSGDAPKLFGTMELINPVFNDDPGAYAPKKQPYIRLDRSRLYMARINTSRMRVNNNEDAADALLALQIEWAEALHSYETTGVAVKNTRLDSRRKEEHTLATLIKTRTATANAQEKAALTAMIRDKLTELGYPPEDAEESQLSLGV
jgi:hypothetical protein